MDLLVCLRVLLQGNDRVSEILPKLRVGKGEWLEGEGNAQEGLQMLYRYLRCAYG